MFEALNDTLTSFKKHSPIRVDTELRTTNPEGVGLNFNSSSSSSFWGLYYIHINETTLKKKHCKEMFHTSWHFLRL